MTSERAQRLRNRAGYSLIELMVAVGIFAVLAAAGLPHIDTRRQDLETATRQVIADLRWARSRSITGGVHYALTWTSERNYRIEKLRESGSDWVVDEVIKTVELPDELVHWGWPDSIEFNTRGMMVSTDWQIWHGLLDSNYGGWRLVAVWPSGQVYEYN